MFEPEAGDCYYLVVPADGSTEGSYGADTAEIHHWTPTVERTLYCYRAMRLTTDALAPYLDHLRSLPFVTDATVVHVKEWTVGQTKRLQALPDPNGPLTILLAPGAVAFEGAVPHTAHPLLVYTSC